MLPALRAAARLLTGSVTWRTFQPIHASSSLLSTNSSF